MEVVGVVAVILLFAAVAYFAWRAEKKRSERLAALARELGWRFDPSKDHDHDDEYAHFKIFARGKRRAAYNTLYGSRQIDGRGYAVKMGDFKYTVDHGKSRSTHNLSYMIMRLPFVTPDLLIRREGVFDKFAGALGFDDIDFESAEFSRGFYVKSSDKKFAYDVVHPRMIEWLLAKKVPAIEIERGRCCIADDGRRWEPDEFKRWLRRAEEFFDLWPDYLLTELDG